ncbi:hypothetical protein L6452_44639 [Arctium lappa]|uniref:Uncharacterized protein n=2 Tax=Arctium lappa TaxID=4217 RepID=A0ACB8XGR4_ARCLA|nr:hypothetical protein L6452_44638 [Arctium lappa]KAI3666001.1 hypothetical protein L6452_44639 [Arctium lappa]
MEEFISLRQYLDENKENIPPFFKTHDNPNTTLKKMKKKNYYRVPLKDITNLLLNSPSPHLPETSPLFPRLQSPAIYPSRAAGDQMSIEDGRSKSLSCQPRLVECYNGRDKGSRSREGELRIPPRPQPAQKGRAFPSGGRKIMIGIADQKLWHLGAGPAYKNETVPP